MKTEGLMLALTMWIFFVFVRDHPVGDGALDVLHAYSLKGRVFAKDRHPLNVVQDFKGLDQEPGRVKSSNCISQARA
jgi:hypothetical protein